MVIADDHILSIFSSDCLAGVPCDIFQLLEAKENRKELQDSFLKKYKSTILSVSLVSPGEIKNNLAYDISFGILRDTLSRYLLDHQIEIKESYAIKDHAGHFLLIAVDGSAYDLKHKLVLLEDHHFLGRLWDIDVIDAEFGIISRTQLGNKARACLLCDNDAKVCGRRQSHSYEELVRKILEMLKEFVFMQSVSELAYGSLLKEVKLTPKPGLVDRNNNGAHKDMNLQLFEGSALSIKPFFVEFLKAGILTDKNNLSYLFDQLRSIGLEAEKAMFSTTNTVNTHKGAIFSFALVLGAIGRLLKTNGLRFSLIDILNQVKECASNIHQDYATSMVSDTRKKMLALYHLKGARGEAASGYETIRKYLIPLYKQYVNYDEEHRLLIYLVALLSFTNDTNLVNRGGIDALYATQERAFSAFKDKDILENKEKLKRFLYEFDADLIQLNLSPGGSADLLALSCFIFDFLDFKKSVTGYVNSIH